MEFVLGLHSHLPYVLNHGRWPHGSDWLCEAALDTYLPLLERLEELATEGTPAPVTIGFTPVLANQLASPTFVKEMAAFFAQRLAACDEARRRWRPPATRRCCRSWSSGGRGSPGSRHCSGRSTGTWCPPFGASRSRAAWKSSAPLPRTATCRCSHVTRASGCSWRWAGRSIVVC